MSKEFKIEDIEKINPMSLFYEFGYDPEEIKSIIKETFGKYFLHEENLERYATNKLVSTWILHVSVERDFPDTLKNLDQLHAIFQRAVIKDSNLSFEAYVQWYPELSQAISRFWSLYNGQPDLHNLGLEDFLDESLRVIGQTIEGISKPFLKLLLHLSKIARNKSTSFETVNNLDLGVVIDELISAEALHDLFLIEPFAIRLNQWRNISYHHNSRINNKKYTIWYNKSGQKEEVEITRDQLSSSLLEILNVHRLLKIVETIFCVDNLESIEGFLSAKEEELNIRSETELLDFYTPISSQGFQITKLESSPELSTLEVRDMMEYPDHQKRGIHASQFLYHLWLHTSSKILRVEYSTYDNRRFLAAEIDSKNFPHDGGTIKLSKLLKDVQFYYISLEMNQNESPFANLKLPKSLDKLNQSFYSQEGDPISLRGFIRKFTLSVLTNYLVFKSEAFDDGDIRVNVGSDGSAIVGEDERGSFILHTPATIKDQKLQKVFMNVIESTINKYKRKELKVSIVEEAINSNRFIFKKGMIKEQIQRMSITNDKLNYQTEP